MSMDFQDLQSYARLLNCFNTPNSIQQGKQLHFLFLKKGVLFSTLSIANRLLQMYVRCGEIDNARNLFDEMPHRNSFTWNTLLEGYLKSGHKGKLLDAFYSMPNKNEFSWNLVISGLMKAGELYVAQSLFDEMPVKNGVAWNTMVHGYAKNGESRIALRLFKDLLNWETLQVGGVFSWDPFVLATVVGACAELGDLESGKQVHARIIVGYVEFDSVLESALVNMYGKCGDLDSASCFLSAMENPDNYSLSSLISGFASCGRIHEARRTFDELKFDPCVVLWNSIISGYVSNDEPVEAISLFIKMCTTCVSGDASTFSSILSACGSLSIVKNCIELHVYVYKLGILYDLVVASDESMLMQSVEVITRLVIYSAILILLILFC